MAAYERKIKISLSTRGVVEGERKGTAYPHCPFFSTSVVFLLNAKLFNLLQYLFVSVLFPPYKSFKEKIAKNFFSNLVSKKRMKFSDIIAVHEKENVFLDFPQISVKIVLKIYLKGNE